MLTGFNAALALGGGVVLVLGLVGGYVKNRLWMAETTICMLIGIVVSPAILGWLRGPELGGDHYVFLMEVARVTLAMAVMGAALRLPDSFEFRHIAGLGLVLGVVLPLMWLTSAALAIVLLGQSVLVALLIGAALAPTDPVVAGSVASGNLAGRFLPARLRNLLTAESGANDGLALLMVMLPILLLKEERSTAITEWLTRVLLWEIAAAVLVGAAAGWLAGRLLFWAYRQPFSEEHSTITIGLALSLTVLAVVRLMGSDGILAVFAAGLALNRFVTKRETRHEHVQEAIGRFFDLPVFILIGIMLPWNDWWALGWSGLAFAGAVLVLRRLPWMLVLRRIIPEMRDGREAGFLGWFGPIGVASIYYAILIRERTDLGGVWPAVSLVVFASVLLHGISATPLTALLGGSLDRRGAPEELKAERNRSDRRSAGDGSESHAKADPVASRGRRA